VGTFSFFLTVKWLSVACAVFLPSDVNGINTRLPRRNIRLIEISSARQLWSAFFSVRMWRVCGCHVLTSLLCAFVSSRLSEHGNSEQILLICLLLTYQNINTDRGSSLTSDRVAHHTEPSSFPLGRLVPQPGMFCVTYESVSISFRTGRLDGNCKWYSSLPLGAVVSLFCESI
jgi:hypothetical protein